jgi:hypothetical protein
MNKDPKDSEPYEVYASDILSSSSHTESNNNINIDHHHHHHHKYDDNSNNKFRDTSTTTINMDNMERHTVDSRNTMMNKNRVSNIGQSKPTISTVTLASVYEDSLVEIPEHFIK